MRSKFYTADYQLTAAQLQEKYESKEVHPEEDYSWWNWYQQVAQRATILGYWDWVVLKLDEEEDELSRDNPYTQFMEAE